MPKDHPVLCLQEDIECRQAELRGGRPQLSLSIAQSDRKALCSELTRWKTPGASHRRVWGPQWVGGGRRSTRGLQPVLLGMREELRRKDAATLRKPGSPPRERTCFCCPAGSPRPSQPEMGTAAPGRQGAQWAFRGPESHVRGTTATSSSSNALGGATPPFPGSWRPEEGAQGRPGHLRLGWWQSSPSCRPRLLCRGSPTVACPRPVLQAHRRAAHGAPGPPQKLCLQAFPTGWAGPSRPLGCGRRAIAAPSVTRSPLQKGKTESPPGSKGNRQAQDVRSRDGPSADPVPSETTKVASGPAQPLLSQQLPPAARRASVFLELRGM